ncbi:hypothetical protein ASD45_14875 [Pseudolabrys sp. Root1462]|jgi:ElaB/YqjD/DUF883 family membrane-anchored ribosome-binding protein|uniref:hypothetical protein n=1 Tax=Pseudolabrys sp. Root1462 TaxID=1736466 RepID=UPI0007034B4D|nr:hypothetical protein [Pseudolabrys sp. Root1462]KQZ01995.1 hypothetical protein ASD45_14875 [Pseudolabrys sp. Root1462]
MSTRSKVAASTTEEIEAIKELMGDLETRLRRIGGSAKSEVSGGASDISDFVNEALAGIMDRVREGAGAVSETVADKASAVGSDALKKVVNEVEARPLTMLAIAAGIGFLFGIAKR